MHHHLRTLTDKLLDALAHYAFGCVCYQRMGMAPREFERVVGALWSTGPEADTIAAVTPAGPPPQAQTAPRRARSANGHRPTSS